MSGPPFSWKAVTAMSELGEIRELLQELIKNQATHAVEQRELKADVEQIKHVLLEGNGTPAMTVRVALAEADLKRLKEERDDKKMPRSAWVAIVLSSVIGIAGIVASVL